MDLKAALMTLGNELVMQHGYDPAMGNRPNVPSTKVIKDFTDFMNESPEARVVLRKLGLKWSMVEQFKTITTLPQYEIANKQYEIVDRLFFEYDFGNEIVKDRSGVSRVGVRTYEIVYFLERKDADSVRAAFVVTFKPDSTEVESVECH